jgi:hypothetical protein
MGCLPCTDRGWSTDRYETWLADTLITQLLPPY